jgi:hypothetical protein
MFYMNVIFLTDPKGATASLWPNNAKGKVGPVLNLAPRYEDVLGEMRYNSTPSLTSLLHVVSCQLHASAALPPGKEPPVPIG